MEPGDLIDFDGWECFADSGAIYHRLHEALRVTESTIRSKHRSSVLHHQSVGRVFYAVAHKCDGLIHHGCDLPALTSARIARRKPRDLWCGQSERGAFLCSVAARGAPIHAREFL